MDVVFHNSKNDIHFNDKNWFNKSAITKDITFKRTHNLTLGKICKKNLTGIKL